MSAPTPNADKGLAELAAIIKQTRRATLQEAARAVCVNCARGDVPTPTERFIFGDGVTRWSHSPSITKSGEPDYCQADEIHDLIAALEEEADDAR